MTDESDPDRERTDPPPPEITRELYLEWRSPRRGERNPHDLTNPVWLWLARNPGITAYSADKQFDGPRSNVEAAWCNHRFGQTRTELPDGRVVAIAGEHEDYYDPDFYIYNDVMVFAPSGDVTIYGYPKDLFPPTDFHTATLVGDRIVIVGNLGYGGKRRHGTTQVRVLDTRTFEISTPATTGTAPDWIHKHDAVLAADGACLTISGGLVDTNESMYENLDDWSLDLATWTWSRLTERRWQQWEIERADGRTNDLFDLDQMRWYMGRDDDWCRERLAKILAKHPPADLEIYDARFSPPFAHELVSAPTNYPRVTRLRAGDATIRYVENSRAIRIVFEGDLPDIQIAAAVEDARAKLEQLEHAPVVKKRIG